MRQCINEWIAFTFLEMVNSQQVSPGWYLIFSCHTAPLLTESHCTINSHCKSYCFCETITRTLVNRYHPFFWSVTHCPTLGISESERRHRVCWCGATGRPWDCPGRTVWPPWHRCAIFSFISVCILSFISLCFTYPWVLGGAKEMFIVTVQWVATNLSLSL